MATVTTSIPLEMRAETVETINAICVNERQLTPRSQATVLALIERGNLAIAKDDDGRLIGWLIAEEILPGVQELGMAYIMPEWRRTGVRDLLLEALIDDGKCNLAITYNPRIAQDLMSLYDFQLSTLRALCIKSRGKILTKRLSSMQSIRAVLQHTSHQKPIYLIREARR